jgi:tetratricopeptide (TPR) repeat protein
MGESLRQLGRGDEAKAHFVRAIEIRPESVEAREGLAHLLGQQGKLQEAIDSFREALRIDPAYAPAHFRLGLLLLDLGQLDEAKRHLTEAIRLDPTAPLPIYVLGAALSREGRADEAAAHFRRALALAPDLVKALAELASLLATSSDPALRNGKEAIELATRACALTRNQDPGVQLVLSEAYAEAGRFGDAVFVAERVLRNAAAQGQQRLIDSARSHLELYRRGNPFRQLRRP